MGTSHWVCFWETKPEEYRDLNGDKPNQLRGHCALFADNEYRLGFHRQLENDYSGSADDVLGLLLMRESSRYSRVKFFTARKILLLTAETAYLPESQTRSDFVPQLLRADARHC